jgi:RNA polymerase sigma-70 factor (ECF subfamily)
VRENPGALLRRVPAAARTFARMRLPDDDHAALDPGELPKHMHRLHRVARSLCGSVPDSEDLVQETFARVLARPRTVRAPDTLPYLLQALRNTHLTGIREAGRRPHTVQLPDDESSTLRSSFALPEAAFECREVLAAVAALPDPFRTALVASDVAGISHRQAAVAFGSCEATIASRVFRARKRVQRAVG